jgi:predicted transcriptional regulator
MEFEAQMSTTQLLIRLPDELAKRLKRNVSPRQRSKFIQRLLEEALPPEDGDDDPLYRVAMAVEKEKALGGEMDEWETATIADGLASGNPRRDDDKSG